MVILLLSCIDTGDLQNLFFGPRWLFLLFEKELLTKEKVATTHAKHVPHTEMQPEYSTRVQRFDADAVQIARHWFYHEDAAPPIPPDGAANNAMMYCTDSAEPQQLVPAGIVRQAHHFFWDHIISDDPEREGSYVMTQNQRRTTRDRQRVHRQRPVGGARDRDAQIAAVEAQEAAKATWLRSLSAHERLVLAAPASMCHELLAASDQWKPLAGPATAAHANDEIDEAKAQQFHERRRALATTANAQFVPFHTPWVHDHGLDFADLWDAMSRGYVIGIADMVAARQLDAAQTPADQITFLSQSAPSYFFRAPLQAPYCYHPIPAHQPAGGAPTHLGVINGPRTWYAFPMCIDWPLEAQVGAYVYRQPAGPAYDFNAASLFRTYRVTDPDFVVRGMTDGRNPPMSFCGDIFGTVWVAATRDDPYFGNYYSVGPRTEQAGETGSTYGIPDTSGLEIGVSHALNVRDIVELEDRSRHTRAMLFGAPPRRPPPDTEFKAVVHDPPGDPVTSLIPGAAYIAEVINWLPGASARQLGTAAVFANRRNLNINDAARDLQQLASLMHPLS